MPHTVILALLVAGIVISLISFTNIRNYAETLYDGPFLIKSAARTVNETLEVMQTSIYCAISNESRDMTDEAISDARKTAVLLQEQVAQLKLYNFGDMGALAGLEANLSELVPMQEYVLVLAAQKRKSDAAAHMEKNNVPVINEAQKELAKYIQSIEAKERELAASLREAKRNAFFFLIVLGAIGVLFAVKDGSFFWRLYKELRQNREHYYPEQIK